jgi:hypothetical protein
MRPTSVSANPNDLHSRAPTGSPGSTREDRLEDDPYPHHIHNQTLQIRKHGHSDAVQAGHASVSPSLSSLSASARTFLSASAGFESVGGRRVVGTWAEAE